MIHGLPDLLAQRAAVRWIEGVGRDVVVVASLNDSSHVGYRIGMPRPGRWGEVFNSDVYDNWVNAWATGNGGHVWADGPADARYAKLRRDHHPS